MAYNDRTNEQLNEQRNKQTIEPALEFCVFSGKQKYFPMWDIQKEWMQDIDQQKRHQSLLLLEHDHVYTLGRGSHLENMLISEEVCKEKGIELAEIDRGGDVTYHGPGQLVGYPVIILDRWKNDAHLYLRKLEETIIQTIAHFGLKGERKGPYTGVWVKDEKIAAIGVKFNRGQQSKAFITSHGFALNVNTDLSMFQNIIPCGIREFGVTSLEVLTGQQVDMDKVIKMYQREFVKEFKFSLE